MSSDEYDNVRKQLRDMESQLSRAQNNESRYFEDASRLKIALTQGEQREQDWRRQVESSNLAMVHL